MTSLFNPIVIVAVFLIAGGGILFALGMRGKRLNDHPVCRKCRFDLFGLPPQTVRCPECGSDLSLRCSTRRGVRQRRRGAILIGALSLAIGGAVVGLAVYERAAGLNWNSYKPTWLLLSETSGNDAARLEAVLKELFSRYASEQLSDSDVQRLVNDGLVRHGNPASAWPDAWSQLIEAAILDGRLTATQTEQYFRQALSATISHRAVALAGTDTPIQIKIVEGRLGSTSVGPGFYLKRSLSRIRLGDSVLAGHGMSGGSISPGGTATSTRSIEVPNVTGIFPVQIEWILSILRSRDDFQSGTPIVEWREVLDSELEVRDDPTGVVRLVADPGLNATIRSSVTIQRLRIRPSARRLSLSGSIQFEPLPINVGFDVVIRQGEREWLLGSRAAAAGNRLTIPLAGWLEGFREGPVSVILRPSVAAALSRLDIDSIWDGDLVFEDVEIEIAPSGSN